MKRKTKIIGSLFVAGFAIAATAAYFTPDASTDYDYDGLTDVGTKVAVEIDGSIYVAGTGTNDAGTDHTDFILVKYDLYFSKNCDQQKYGI